jgi:hypothetical protein
VQGDKSITALKPSLFGQACLAKRVWPSGFCQARGFARDDNIFKNLRADNRQFIYGVKSLPVEAH